jgi:twitching motility protein PilT
MEAGDPMDEGSTKPDGLVPELAEWLRGLSATEMSDLHLKAGSPPAVRDGGRVRRLDHPALSSPDAEKLAETIIPANRRSRFDEDGEVDFAYSVPGVGRFRANVFRQRGSVSMVFRKLRMGGPPFAELQLPPVVEKLAMEVRGLVLVTGPTGSGKTTTLAAMIEHINRTRPVHIVTIEDPIEVLHTDHTAWLNQREVGQDSKTFFTALRAALRQDPDVILIGEMRDAETVQAALQAAETGHLVLSTLHTVNATETVNRLLDFFPPFQQHQIRLTLAGALRGIICQRLVPGIRGDRVACLEVLVNTGRIAERIANPEITAEIEEVVAKGGHYGMRTFDQSLVEMVKLGKVSIEDAMEAASESHDLHLMLQQAGLSHTGARTGLSFERDIKPLFDEEQRARVKWAYDLWDYASFKENAAEILKRIEAEDSPFEGGWPEERLALLRSWLREGLMAP